MRRTYWRDEAMADRGPELFEALNELARMDEANRGRLGARFLEAAATSIDGLALPDGLEATVTHGLTMAYARANVKAPEALVERLIGQIGPLRESRRLPAGIRKPNGERRGGSVRGGRR